MSNYFFYIPLIFSVFACADFGKTSCDDPSFDAAERARCLGVNKIPEYKWQPGYMRR